MKRFLAIACVLLTVCVAALVFARARPEVAGYPLKYERSIWMAAKPSKRILMARDVVERKMLHNLTATQVTELLGPPTSRSRHEGDSHWSYLVGNPLLGFALFGDDKCVLRVRTDVASGVVREYSMSSF
ncbi:MAG TPA: hypothetical protein PKN64_10370 [Casimicrobium sp.]|jgi:hypothetical protein|nr:hypothetical protein [Casimicrobium sp.]